MIAKFLHIEIQFGYVMAKHLRTVIIEFKNIHNCILILLFSYKFDVLILRLKYKPYALIHVFII